MQPIQLDFFKSYEECERDAMRQSIAEIKISSDKVRRKLFAEQGLLKKEVFDLSERLQIIERNICAGV